MPVSWRTSGNTSVTGIKKKVYVGLSGGVDSAVSAALLQKEGYDVTGVFIRIALSGYPCTAGEDKLSAMRVAAHLKIPFVEIDLSEEYAREVFSPTVGEFGRGRTPNPDTLCNREIKFGAFFSFAMSQGADYVATGHYAQTKEGLLYKSADAEKDQSYFVWMVPEGVLKQTIFPVGGMEKRRVRALAKKFGLPNALRKDSQGLCFLGGISVEALLKRELPLVPGDVLDEEGEIIGSHEGVPAYTLGQRHGFRLHSRSPDSKPLYVIDKDSEFNTITVSASRMPRFASKTNAHLIETNWIGPLLPGAYTARYRYRQELISAEVKADTSGVTLQEAHYVPEGQSLVLYDGARCLGGGIVDKSELL